MMDPSATRIRVSFHSTCKNIIRQTLTDRVYDPRVRMTPSLPDDCDAKEAGRGLCFGTGGRQGGCGSEVRGGRAGRPRACRESRRGCCFGKGGACRWKELDVVLGLGLREQWVGHFGRRLT